MYSLPVRKDTLVNLDCTCQCPHRKRSAVLGTIYDIVCCGGRSMLLLQTISVLYSSVLFSIKLIMLGLLLGLVSLLIHFRCVARIHTSRERGECDVARGTAENDFSYSFTERAERFSMHSSTVRHKSYVHKLSLFIYFAPHIIMAGCQLLTKGSIGFSQTGRPARLRLFFFHSLAHIFCVFIAANRVRLMIVDGKKLACGKSIHASCSMRMLTVSYSYLYKGKPLMLAVGLTIDACFHFSSQGHRASHCNHADRPLVEIKKKGRPATQCVRCRELRTSRQLHVKCDCNDSSSALSSLLLFANAYSSFMQAQIRRHDDERRQQVI